MSDVAGPAVQVVLSFAKIHDSLLHKTSHIAYINHNHACSQPCDHDFCDAFNAFWQRTSASDTRECAVYALPLAAAALRS